MGRRPTPPPLFGVPPADLGTEAQAGAHVSREPGREARGEVSSAVHLGRATPLSDTESDPHEDDRPAVDDPASRPSGARSRERPPAPLLRRGRPRPDAHRQSRGLSEPCSTTRAHCVLSWSPEACRRGRRHRHRELEPLASSTSGLADAERPLRRAGRASAQRRDHPRRGRRRLGGDHGCSALPRRRRPRGRAQPRRDRLLHGARLRRRLPQAALARAAAACGRPASGDTPPATPSSEETT